MFRGLQSHRASILRRLAVEMNKDRFNRNKQRYINQWVTPIVLLEVGAKLKKPYGKLALGKPKLFRNLSRYAVLEGQGAYKTHVAAAVRSRRS